METTTDFEIDKKDSNFGTLTVTDEDNNYVSLFLHNIGEDSKPCWTVLSFLGAKIGNTRYRKDKFYDKLYEKDGKGRESKKAKEHIRELYSIALDEVFGI